MGRFCGDGRLDSVMIHSARRVNERERDVPFIDARSFLQFRLRYFLFFLVKVHLAPHALFACGHERYIEDV